MPKNKTEIYNEMVRLSASSPGATKEQRFAAFVATEDGKRLFREYNAAPLPTPSASEPQPRPLTAAEAEKAFRLNPTSESAILGAIEAKAREIQAAEPALSLAEAQGQAWLRNSELHKAYVALPRS